MSSLFGYGPFMISIEQNPLVGAAYAGGCCTPPALLCSRDCDSMAASFGETGRRGDGETGRRGDGETMAKEAPTRACVSVAATTSLLRGRKELRPGRSEPTAQWFAAEEPDFATY